MRKRQLLINSFRGSVNIIGTAFSFWYLQVHTAWLVILHIQYSLDLHRLLIFIICMFTMFLLAEIARTVADVTNKLLKETFYLPILII